MQRRPPIQVKNIYIPPFVLQDLENSKVALRRCKKYSEVIGANFEFKRWPDVSRINPSLCTFWKEKFLHLWARLDKVESGTSPAVHHIHVNIVLEDVFSSSHLITSDCVVNRGASIVITNIQIHACLLQLFQSRYVPIISRYACLHDWVDHILVGICF